MVVVWGGGCNTVKCWQNWGEIREVGVGRDSWWFGMGAADFWVGMRGAASEFVAEKRGGGWNLIASSITSLIQYMYWLPNARIKQCCAENNLAGNGNWSIWSWTSCLNFYSIKYILFSLIVFPPPPSLATPTCYSRAFLQLAYSHGQHFLLRTYLNSVALIPGLVVSWSRTRLVPAMQFNVSYLSAR